MGLFVFDYLLANKRVRVLYCVDSIPAESQVTSSLQEFADRSPPPDRIVILSPRIGRICNAVDSIVRNPRFAVRAKEFTRHSNPPRVSQFAYDAIGKVTDSEGVSIDDDELSTLCWEGMTTIFRSRKGLLSASTGYHYSKPSKQHSQHFIRAGNVIACNAEVGFLAFCCLPYVPNDLSSIYCDTGAIFPVAYALQQQRFQLTHSEDWPSITSFGSYEGLTTFRFKSPSTSLVLISASTSPKTSERLAVGARFFVSART